MSELTIPAVLARAAGASPDVEAVVDGDVRVTYAELGERVREAAGAFAGAGVAPGDRVAIWAPNSLSWIVTVLGAVSAGATLVPLNTRFKGDEARWPLAKARVKALFVEDGFLGIDYPGMLGLDREGTFPGLPDLETVVTFNGAARPGVITWGEFVGKAGADPVDVRPEDVADILFTSGTTGRPKGVMCTHEQNIRTYEAWTGRTGVKAGDRYLIVNPMFHSFGYKAGVLACLLKGATMVLQRTFDVPETLRLIEQEKITVLPGPPTIYTSLLDAPGRAEHDLSSLRLAVTGAADVPVALVRRIKDELFPQVVTAYGLTESSGTVTACSVDDDDETIATTCGRPIADVEVAIVDEKGERVPAGTDGEVLVRGYNVMSGYLDDPEATAETIRDGWLDTGDRGRLDERGNLTITGRTKEMFVVGGFNVYPAEVEDVLARHDAVAESGVVGVPDPRMGEVGRAYVRLRPGREATADELIAHCRELLANFKVPREVVLVDDLPKTASGKVRRVELKERP
ncbi:FadD3 family acyl-CoA ligase [Actinomadura livida]|uniref:3-((3aS,4S,7aS)-7a-methyl-1, 5-dioxo-octahydro-1H- inden-4-yl)propanoate--CoA ligase FadD3 n=1 Tax=Actinomadura livida TaxID=79909 RepID=A0A7W7N0Y0_9ACTN|nr:MULTISPECIES: FadD3 family acyl-CoA ligase [Actinomadura]MBB4777380.1 acyl-CoA synthetase (AMP-forming)/AMP-acid ligase II [Actinomadura catellatispora]GGU19647.1 3-[(3aS,4S,7aS)-7a-methyl-1,5-dioxo-octahydro-1H-inden-4-yl]propanoyl:CoA ligase [Actinomadura livida]